jgi:hypothetical protein
MDNFVVLATELSPRGQGDVRQNPDRITRATRLLHMKLGAQVILLPGGFLRAPARSHLGQVSAPLIEAARASNTAIVFGVDTHEPFIGAWAPDMSGPVFCPRQTEPRLLRVAGRSVALFLDDEYFDDQLRETVIRLAPDVGLLSMHKCDRNRFWKLRRSPNGFPYTMAAHRTKPSTPSLVCPRGWRLCDTGFMERDIMCSIFYVDEEDGALDVPF